MRCAVCGLAIGVDGPFKYHARLRAHICGTCPLTDVMGEDVSMHTLMWYPPPPTNTPPSAVTRDAALGGATTSVPSLTGEGSGGTEASAVGPPRVISRDGT